MKVSGKSVDSAWLLIIGLPALAFGLGGQWWGVAFIGAVLIAVWLLKRYPPRQSTE